VASHEAYTTACAQLFARLWAALASLAPPEPAPPPPRTALTLRCEILRLELVVLIDACESPAWHALLSLPQRSALKATLQGVLEILTGGSEIPGEAAVDRAQDELLDAILEQIEAQGAAQLKLAASLGSPLPLYLATCG
jgi:hypothetical protein